MVKLLLGLDAVAVAARRRRRARRRHLPRAQLARRDRRRAAAPASRGGLGAPQPGRRRSSIDQLARLPPVIARLKGTLAEKTPNRLIVDVGGVGYDVLVPLSTFYVLGEPGAPVTLRIHTHVREDVIALYGFATALEQDLFERLISISGIGPKLALAVLSGIDPGELVRAIRTQDVARLTRIPGVGKKTAERIGLELKDRLPLAPPAAAGSRRRRRRRRSARRSAVGAGQPRIQRPVAEKAVERALKKTPDATRSKSCAARDPARADDDRPRMTDDRLVNASPIDDDVQYEAGLRPRSLDEYIGQDRVREQLQVVDRRREAARRGARSRAALRPARARQDDARRASSRNELGVADPADGGAGDREAGRPRRDAHEPAGARGALHRRNPPHEPGDRGDPLSGDGGLRARHHHRPGAERALGQGAAAALHADRRDDADRAADLAAARALRHRPPAGLLHRATTSWRS